MVLVFSICVIYFFKIGISLSDIKKNLTDRKATVILIFSLCIGFIVHYY